jgi:anthranilate phosphoribosyltransferase
VLSGNVLTFTLDPTQLEVPSAEPGSLTGGDPDQNAGIAKTVLQGEPGPARDVVLLNAAAALYVGGMAHSMAEGLQVAAESVDSGRAAQALSRWVEVSNAA